MAKVKKKKQLTLCYLMQRKSRKPPSKYRKLFICFKGRNRHLSMMLHFLKRSYLSYFGGDLDKFYRDMMEALEGCFLFSKSLFPAML